MKIFPVILSGGSGKRLWPISRKQFPKQYQNLTGRHSMLQETVLRLQGIENLANPIIICNVEHRFIVADQLQQINALDASIILEPIGRNSAPAIAAASVYLTKDKKNTDAALLILPADHVIQNTLAFHKAINDAKEQVELGKLATFGVLPTFPNIEYGYIEAEQNINNTNMMYSKSFKEKPNVNLANQYLNENTQLSGKNLPIKWYWNSGMFMFKANSLLNELSIHKKDLIAPIKDSVMKAKHDFDFIRLEENAFSSCEDISIDYALMEKSEKVIIVPFDAEWSDVGSWSALYEISNKDSSNNVVKGDIFIQDTTNSFISSSSRIIATIGLDNLIVVDTDDVILVANKNKANEVKAIVEKLEDMSRVEANVHRKVYRPWGWFDSIELGENFQVKRLHVNPGAQLSLQMHHKRAEHWVVVSGIATITKGEEKLSLRQGESTYIPIGVKHDLKNKTNKALVVIEVQSGIYLGEDDIIRFNDIYGRTNS
mgnify:FL=1